MSDRFPDREFEKLFQKGSEKYDFEYNPNAWEGMEVLLNKRKKRKVLFWWFGGVIAAAFLLWGGLQISGVFDPVSDLANTNIGAVELKEKSADVQEDELHLNEGGEYVQEESKEIIAGRVAVSETKINPDAAQAAADNKAVLDGSASSKKNSSRSGILNDTRQDAGRTTANEVERSAGNRDINAIEDQQKSLDASKADNPVSEEDNLQSKKISDQVINVRGWNIERLMTRRIKGISLSVLNAMPVIQPLIQQEGHGAKNDHSTALMLGLSIGLSSSSAGVMGYSDVDLKYGLAVQYFFKPKWSLGIGVNYINDSYQAGPDDYAPGNYFWTDEAPSWTDATCKILEVPISVGFYPNGFASSGFFATSGIASTIMVNEKYYYNYEDPQPEYVKYWHGTMDSKDWFSMLEFGVGYQKILSDKSVLRLSPYIQFPISGIGHGKVMLRNFGASVQYGFRVK